MFPDVTGVRIPEVNRTVYVPVGPLIARSLNTAAPDPLLVAVAPESVAPAGPDAMTAVTVAPDSSTGSPSLSAICTTGWVGNGVPLAAFDPGGVARSSFSGFALIFTVAETTDRLAVSNRRV